MEYPATPATFVSTESGKIVGPDSKNKFLVRVTTESVPEAMDRGCPTQNNVVVLCIEDLVKKVHGEQSLVSYALKLQDCQEICQQLLCHLMASGDEVASYLVRALIEATSGGNSGTESE
jgi:hypothetical protein